MASEPGETCQCQSLRCTQKAMAAYQACLMGAIWVRQRAQQRQPRAGKSQRIPDLDVCTESPAPATINAVPSGGGHERQRSVATLVAAGYLRFARLTRLADGD